MPKPFEETGFLQLIDVAVVVVSRERRFLSGRGIALYRKLLHENMARIDRGEDPMGGSDRCFIPWLVAHAALSLL